MPMPLIVVLWAHGPSANNTLKEFEADLPLLP
jgi:hypothetical protein